MKVYISADIEGVTGSTHWDETKLNSPDWIPYAKQMTDETVAAVKGALAAGADEVLVKDAHDSGRNIDINALPEEAKLIRGWIGDPMCMVSGLDETFDAVIFIGYHNTAGTITNPLAHTMNPDEILFMKINGENASEFLIHTYAAALYDVPVVFVSGDIGLIEEVKKINKNIFTLGVKDGIGSATINMNPKKVIRRIENLVEESLKGDLSSKKVKLPCEFNLEIEYIDFKKAYKYSFYPGAEFKEPRTVIFRSNDYFEILRIILFVT